MSKRSEAEVFRNRTLLATGFLPFERRFNRQARRDAATEFEQTFHRPFTGPSKLLSYGIVGGLSLVRGAIDFFLPISRVMKLDREFLGRSSANTMASVLGIVADIGIDKYLLDHVQTPHILLTIPVFYSAKAITNFAEQHVVFETINKLRKH